MVRCKHADRHDREHHETGRHLAPEDQEELADHARVIEARRSGVYRVGAAERAAINEATAQADRGDFADEETVAAADKRQGV